MYTTVHTHTHLLNHVSSAHEFIFKGLFLSFVQHEPDMKKKKVNKKIFNQDFFSVGDFYE